MLTDADGCSRMLTYADIDLGDVAQRLLRAEKQRIDHKREAVRALEQVLTYADVC
jgi:hypothetical protein